VKKRRRNLEKWVIITIFIIMGRVVVVRKRR
jgi:hypothetical protein